MDTSPVVYTSLCVSVRTVASSSNTTATRREEGGTETRREEGGREGRGRGVLFSDSLSNYIVFFRKTELAFQSLDYSLHKIRKSADSSLRVP